MQPVENTAEQDRGEQWRQFFATQMERQTAAAEATAKKTRTIEIQLSALLALIAVVVVVAAIAALGSA